MARKRYTNIDNINTDRSLKQFRQWREERRRKKKDYSYIIPNSPPQLDYLEQNRIETSITWIGHSTFFIQYRGFNIVTDPVWANRMGFQRRLGTPGIPISEVPEIDVILISHSHYDHMHISSIRKLYKPKTILIVPVGLARKMRRKGFKRVYELSWWEHLEIGHVRFSFVPTQHWTRRTLFDMNTSHWGGFVLEPAQEHHLIEDSSSEYDLRAQPLLQNEFSHKDTRQVIYFAGDSGYFKGFEEIGKRYNIDIALLPIGAYEPEWFMTSQHTTPEEALQAFIDVKAKLMIPMHYGTFRLADDTAREALDRLEEDRKRRDIPKEAIKILLHGETLRYPISTS